MKKVLAILLMISMLLCFSACGKEKITLDLACEAREGFYTGDMVDGVPNGQGKFVSKNAEGKQWTYEGEFKNGHFDGRGKTTWSGGQEEIGLYKDDVLVPMRGEEIKSLYSTPKEFKNHCVELIGVLLNAPEVTEDGLVFQMWTDIENMDNNTIVSVQDTDLKLEDGDYVRVVGIVGDSVEGENMLGGKVSALTVRARECEKISYKEAVSPTLKEISVNQTQTQFGYAVTVQKVEFAEKETRVYIKVDNHGSSYFSLYSFDAKLSQNGKQYKEEDNWDADYPEIEPELLQGNYTEGVIVFPAIEQSSFTLMLNAYSGNYKEHIKDYTFKIEV